MSEYETYEALQRMLEAHWIEFVGRRDPGSEPAPAPQPVRRDGPRHGVLHELVVAAAVVLATLGLRYASTRLDLASRPQLRNDVYVAAQVRDLRYALDLYRRENGHYPPRIEALVDDRWTSAGQLRAPGYMLLYRADPGGQQYRLEMKPDR
jgi:hypothetical protein